MGKKGKIKHAQEVNAALITTRVEECQCPADEIKQLRGLKTPSTKMNHPAPGSGVPAKMR